MSHVINRASSLDNIFNLLKVAFLSHVVGIEIWQRRNPNGSVELDQFHVLAIECSNVENGQLSAAFFCFASLACCLLLLLARRRVSYERDACLLRPYAVISSLRSQMDNILERCRRDLDNRIKTVT